jgi:hypothetical protein
MATKTKTLKKKSASKASDTIRKRFEEMKSRSERSEGSNVYDELDWDKNKRRILPSTDPSLPFFFETGMHWRQGPDKKHIRCIGEDCPICLLLEEGKKEANSHPRGSAMAKKLWKKAHALYAPKARFLMNVFDPKTPDEVKVLGIGSQAMEAILAYYFDEEDYGDFSSVDKGFVVTIIKSKTGPEVRDVDYSADVVSSDPDPIDWEVYESKLHDLETASGTLYSPAEIEAILVGEEYDDEDDDGTLEDIDDDEDLEDDE